MVGRKTTFKKRNLEVVKTNFETKKESKDIYGARSLCLEGRNRMFSAIEVSMMPSLVSIRNWDLEPSLDPELGFRASAKNDIPDTNTKIDFGQKNDTFKFRH